MKLISWNVQGCNSLLKRWLLKRKIRVEKLASLFLQETKCSSEELVAFNKWFWKGADTMAFNAIGAARGLGILWNPNLVSLSNFSASQNMVSSNFNVLGTSIQGVITNPYGPFQLTNKPTFLEEIHSMSERVEQGHWILQGKCNLIRSLERKKGGIITLSGVGTTFNKVIEDLHRVDV